MPKTTPTPVASQAVGANIRAELSRKGLTQADLGSVLGVSQSGVSKRLRGVTAFDIDELTSVAGWLDVPLDVLLAGVAAEKAAS